jgi:hypothetical protein
MIQTVYNLQSNRAQVKNKLNLNVEINGMKEFRDVLRQMEKDIKTQVLQLRNYYIPKPMFSAFTVKKWMQRLSIAGVILGIAANELWPRLKKLM